jgi:hypothetical protein
MEEKFDFDFRVEGLNEAETETLLDCIVDFITTRGGIMGGGFVPVIEADEPEEVQP